MSTVIALIALCFTMLAAMVGCVWRLATLVGRFETSVKLLDEIPTIQNRVTLLESVGGAHGSKLGEHDSRINTLWEKFFSQDKHLAVTRERLRQSRPDFGGSDD